MSDSDWMAVAVGEAVNAANENEVPVGAVLVDADGRELCRAHNLTEQNGDVTAHAEMLCLRQIAGRKYLNGCTLYVTMEPCPMCAGALIHARLGRVVYGVRDARQGAFGSVVQLNGYPLESKPTVECIKTPEAGALLTSFFKKKRKSEGDEDRHV